MKTFNQFMSEGNNAVSAKNDYVRMISWLKKHAAVGNLVMAPSFTNVDAKTGEPSGGISMSGLDLPVEKILKAVERIYKKGFVIPVSVIGLVSRKDKNGKRIQIDRFQPKTDVYR